MAIGIAALVLLEAANGVWAASAYASNSNIWLGEKTTIFCDFNGSSPAEAVWASVTTPVLSRIAQFSAVTSSLFSMEYTPPVAGNYSISCMGKPETSAAFRVSDLQLRITSLLSPIYTDGAIDLSAELKRAESGENVVDGAAFKVIVAGKEIPLKPPYFYGDIWHFSSAEATASIGAGNHTLELFTAVGTKTVVQRTSISIRPPVDFFISSFPRQVSNGDAISLRIYAADHGTTLIGSAALSVSLNGAQQAADISGDEIRFTAPKMAPGKYKVRAEMSYKGSTYADEEEIEYGLLMHGDAAAPLLKDVNGKLLFTADAFEKQIEIRKGQYRDLVPKGTYTVKVDIPPVKVTYSNVRIESDYEELIRFDTFADGGIEGLTLVTGMAMEFSAPFGNAVAEIWYNAEQVANESSMILQKCPSWNLDGRTCAGSWMPTDGTIDTIRNTIRINIPEKAAIAIGEKKKLKIEARTDRKEYFASDKAEITGIVTDAADGKPVADADARISIAGGEDVAINTDAIGMFKTSVRTADIDGAQEAQIEVSKANFMPAKASVSWISQKRRSLVLVLPQTAESAAGKELLMEIGVLNNGQTRLDNLQVKIDGLPQSWFTFAPNGKAAIDIGEEVKVRLNVRLQQPEKAAYNIFVSASAGGVDISDSFALMIRNETAAVPIIIQTPQGDSLTGLITSLQRSDIPIIILIGIMAFLIYREWRSRSRAAAEQTAATEIGEEAGDLKSSLLKAAAHKGQAKNKRRRR